MGAVFRHPALRSMDSQHLKSLPGPDLNDHLLGKVGRAEFVDSDVVH